MSTIASIVVQPAAMPLGMTFRSKLWIYLGEVRDEFVKLTRIPAYSLMMILTPVLFYFVFAASQHGHPDMARYGLASFTAFGVLSPGLLGIGMVLAMDRERGLLALKRALPMPPGAYLSAKLVMAALLAAVISLLITVVARFSAGVDVSPERAGALLIAAAAGVLPFCALGLYIGSLVKGENAGAVLNGIYLPMSFLSGLWMPLNAVPYALAVSAPLWPAYHLAQLTRIAVGDIPATNIGIHVGYLLTMTVACFALSYQRLRKRG
jgi:ABC-2 type transport system permease protein